MVDENGSFIHPDRLMGIFAKDVLESIESGASDEERTIFFDVKCSMALEEAILGFGGIPKMVRTGHTFMKMELRANPGSPMAGEMSGHFFMNDCWDGFDDSIYNAARLLEIVSRDPSPDEGGVNFSERFGFMPEYPSTDEGKVPLVGERNSVMSAIKQAYADMEYSEVDGVRVRYERGWFLCRPSNTEPILVLRAEAKDRSSLEEILVDVEERIGHLADIDKLK